MRQYKQRNGKDGLIKCHKSKPMTNKEIRKTAKQSILNGKTKQETFEELKGISYKTAKKTANIIQTIPSLQTRRMYKLQYIVLIVLLSGTILFKMKAIIPFIIENEAWLLIILLAPIINILVGIITYKPNSYMMLALLSWLWQYILCFELVRDTFKPLILIDIVIASVFIELGSLLHSKLFPEYLTEKELYKNKQGQNRQRIVIKFKD